ncbi:cob(I)yrinic acid a,c-diamide adenosyltransferase [Neptunomonas phycophila]|uniref:cob(I)yrinic acid a,c-diamide adenosyltransferase n=1 Tax=Neptunomonas phycophila TaxID=1572645 RepID=UPI0026E29F7C|nr:cob(I)yrinic acid a,c-diamide adenosyltransferase [Neptunomonas phycophila]MDO6467656.1 cob(I)yrinic acid a,c-diamide adenosyltransferase [Neptunomonas phycophila]
MADRLTKIYTRTGDSGTTGLANGTRISKSAPRIETLGNIDELNSALGLLLCEIPTEHNLRPLFERIQHDLFDLGGELAMADPNYVAITDSAITQLEQALDNLNATLPPLKEFILPGGNRPAAQCHVARTLCRRAERSMILMNQDEKTDANTGNKYLNRLSDLLFVAARSLARENGGQEIYWKPAQCQ